MGVWRRELVLSMSDPRHLRRVRSPGLGRYDSCVTLATASQQKPDYSGFSIQSSSSMSTLWLICRALQSKCPGRSSLDIQTPCQDAHCPDELWSYISVIYHTYVLRTHHTWRRYLASTSLFFCLFKYCLFVF